MTKGGGGGDMMKLVACEINLVSVGVYGGQGYAVKKRHLYNFPYFLPQRNWSGTPSLGGRSFYVTDAMCSILIFFLKTQTKTYLLLFFMYARLVKCVFV